MGSAKPVAGSGPVPFEDSVIGVLGGNLGGTERKVGPCSMLFYLNPECKYCTSIAATRLVRITHPFHPLSGKRLPCVGERHNRYGRRLPAQLPLVLPVEVVLLQTLSLGPQRDALRAGLVGRKLSL